MASLGLVKYSEEERNTVNSVGENAFDVQEKLDVSHTIPKMWCVFHVITRSWQKRVSPLCTSMRWSVRNARQIDRPASSVANFRYANLWVANTKLKCFVHSMSYNKIQATQTR